MGWMSRKLEPKFCLRVCQSVCLTRQCFWARGIDDVRLGKSALDISVLYRASVGKCAMWYPTENVSFMIVDIIMSAYNKRREVLDCWKFYPSLLRAGSPPFVRACLERRLATYRTDAVLLPESTVALSRRRSLFQLGILFPRKSFGREGLDCRRWSWSLRQNPLLGWQATLNPLSDRENSEFFHAAARPKRNRIPTETSCPILKRKVGKIKTYGKTSLVETDSSP